MPTSMNLSAFRMDYNRPQIIVPAELVARSHPTGHSVPIVREKRKLLRPHPYRLVAMALVTTLVLGLGVVGTVYYAVEVGQGAGYHLACPIVGTGRWAHYECHWESPSGRS